MGVKDIIVVDISDKKLVDVWEFGCKYIINLKNEDLKECVFVYINGFGVDIVFECVGFKIM